MQIHGYTSAPAVRHASYSVDPKDVPESPSHGLDLANLDTSVKPQQDFYKFATGGWIARHPIPDNKTSVGSFDLLAERNREALHGLLEDLSSKSWKPGSNEQKVADFYASGMDTATIEAAGARPLQPLFDRIDAISDLNGLSREVAHLHNVGIAPFFGFGPSPDLKDSTRMVADVGQGGLGLPERSYYFDTDEKSVEIRNAYQQHIGQIFQLLGDSPEAAAAAAETVMRVETRLAEASASAEQLRDPNGLYNPRDRKQLQEETPSFNWDAYLEGRGQGGLQTVNNSTPRFFTELEKTLTETPLGDLKTYLRWHTIEATSWALSKGFGDENFNFSKVLSGVKTPNERWKKIVTATDSALGEALGQKYVEKHFPPESKQRVQEMLGNIRAVLREDLQELSWMSPETRAQATEKLDAISEKIGYPDKWTDYSELKVDRGVFIDNVLRANEFATRKSLAQIGQPTDRSKWEMSPPTVNAYYHPLHNEIVFPAGIMQPPFFNPQADDAVNYGGLGVVIGHEITHGFDDSGAQFDAQGNLRNWWTEEDKVRFEERSQGIIAQANAFEVQPGLFLKGPLVVGESMADKGGAELAFQALERSLEGKDRERIDGFTPEQRFFLGFAQVWATNERPESERLQVTTDPHPVARFRVNGTLSNMPEFAEAFDAKPGDPMVLPESQRVVLWEPARD